MGICVFDSKSGLLRMDGNSRIAGAVRCFQTAKAGMVIVKTVPLSA
jgi:hypothetical protein